MSNALKLRLSFMILISLFFSIFLVKEGLGKINDEQNEELLLKKIDPELLNLQGETSVIIEFSKKPKNYKQLIRSLEGSIVNDYDSIEGVAVKLKGEDIPKLAKFENLVKVHKDSGVKTLLHSSALAISADDVWNSGFTGKDIKVCIVDTGVDYKHPALGSCTPLVLNGNVEPYALESSHPYPISYNHEWTITKPGYTNISVHFANISLDKGYDFIYIKDKNGNILQSFTGEYKDVWSVSVPGDAIKINLVSDWYLCLYGFYIDKVINGSASFSFESCKKVVAGYDFINHDSDPMDDNTHGTHVTGIISSDDSYSRGIANGTKIMMAKVLNNYGQGNDSDVISGIEWCVNNSAQIISMSLGGDSYPGTCDNDILAKAVNSANEKGVAVVVAAGNNGQYGLTTPACASGAIAVGATDNSYNVVGFSSKGPELDITAPGYQINSTTPRNNWNTKSGTSMAAPHVSGVAALMLEANPYLSNSDIKRILYETSDPINKCYECTWESGDCTNYYGTEIQCTKNVTGSGVINASKAISRSQSDCLITVQYQDNCPRSGATVYTLSPEAVLGTTDENGKLLCNSLADGTYSIRAKWPDQNSQFGDDTTLVINNRYGRAVISKNSDYTNGTEACGDNDCSGFKYCLGDTKRIECNSWNTECDTKKCCQCNGGTLFNPKENYDSSQNNDCNIFNLEGIATCDWIPDNYHPTWDLRNPFASQCTGLDQCSQGDSSINHNCSKSQCSAQCDNNLDCSNKCDNKKWYSTYSCNNQCNCEFSNPVCSKSKCGAECERDSDCSVGTCRADCTCGIWETIYSGSGGYPVIGLEIYNSKLYALSQYVMYVFNGTSWNTVSLPLSIPTSTVYNGKLYLGGQGNSNGINSGTIYNYDGSSWKNVLNTTGSYARTLGNYSGKLYAGTMFGTPNLYVCSGSCDNPASWSIDTNFASLNPCQGVIPGLCTISSYGVFNGKFYLNTGKNAFMFNGTSWKKVTSNSEFFLYPFFNDSSVGSIFAPELYNSNYYVITKDSPQRCPVPGGFCGRVWKYNGTAWNTSFDYNYTLFDLEVYNGRLYVGTENKIYFYDGNNWQLTYNASSGAEYALVLKTWNSKIYVGFGNGLVAKDDMTEPLVLTLSSPQNKTYTTSSIPLTFTTNRPVSWTGYSLDRGANVTITGSTTLTGLTNGVHNLVLYANDAIGKTSSSSKVYFTVSVPTCTCTAWVKSDCEDDGTCTICFWTRTCNPKGCSLEYRTTKACRFY